MVPVNRYFNRFAFDYGYVLFGIILRLNSCGYHGTVLKGCDNCCRARFQGLYHNSITDYRCSICELDDLFAALLRIAFNRNKLNNIFSLGYSPSSNNAFGKVDSCGCTYGNIDFSFAAKLVFNCGGR